MSAPFSGRFLPVFRDRALLVFLVVLMFSFASAQQIGPSIRLARRYAGADASERIRACIADLPPTGGTCDATNLHGTQVIGSDFTADLIQHPKPVKLLLGRATFICRKTGPDYCIQIPSGFRLIGSGDDQTILRFDDNYPAWLRLVVTAPHASHIEITGMTLDGNVSHYGGDRKIRQNHGVMVKQAKYVFIHENRFHDFWGDAVMLWGTTEPSSDARISRNSFKDDSRADIALISAEHVKVNDNTFEKNVRFESVHGEPDDESQIERNILIYNNTLVGGGISFTAQRYRGEGDNPNVQHIDVVHNTIRGAHILMQRTPFCRVIDNHVINPNSVEAAIEINTHSCTIEANSIIWTSEPCKSCLGIYASGSATWVPHGWWGKGDNRIAGNHVTNARGAAISIYDSSDNLISGNEIVSVFVYGETAAGIGIGGSGRRSLRNVVIDNLITDPKPAPTTKFGLNVGPGEYPLVGGNKFEGVTVRGVSNPTQVEEYTPTRLRELVRERPTHGAAAKPAGSVEDLVNSDKPRK
jgi:parallel beta-helix repeat protein